MRDERDHGLSSRPSGSWCDGGDWMRSSGSLISTVTRRWCRRRCAGHWRVSCLRAGRQHLLHQHPARLEATRCRPRDDRDGPPPGATTRSSPRLPGRERRGRLDLPQPRVRKRRPGHSILYPLIAGSPCVAQGVLSWCCSCRGPSRSTNPRPRDARRAGSWACAGGAVSARTEHRPEAHARFSTLRWTALMMIARRPQRQRFPARTRSRRSRRLVGTRRGSRHITG